MNANKNKKNILLHLNEYCFKSKIFFVFINKNIHDFQLIEQLEFRILCRGSDKRENFLYM